MTLPTEKDLQQAWEELQDIHKEHLQVHGVKIPAAAPLKQCNAGFIGFSRINLMENNPRRFKVKDTRNLARNNGKPRL